jgi:hypothetical protein
MSDIYDVYGLPSELQVAADLVSTTLELSLELHSSDYWGDYYSTPLLDDTIRVIWNADEEPDEVPYDQYPQYSVIVEVNESPVADEIRDKLVAAGFTHLEREVVDS